MSPVEVCKMSTLESKCEDLLKIKRKISAKEAEIEEYKALGESADEYVLNYLKSELVNLDLQQSALSFEIRRLKQELSWLK